MEDETLRGPDKPGLRWFSVRLRARIQDEQQDENNLNYAPESAKTDEKHVTVEALGVVPEVPEPCPLEQEKFNTRRLRLIRWALCVIIVISLVVGFIWGVMIAFAWLVAVTLGAAVGFSILAGIGVTATSPPKPPMAKRNMLLKRISWMGKSLFAIITLFCTTSFAWYFSALYKEAELGHMSLNDVNSSLWSVAKMAISLISYAVSLLVGFDLLTLRREKRVNAAAKLADGLCRRLSIKSSFTKWVLEKACVDAVKFWGWIAGCFFLFGGIVCSVCLSILG